MKILYLPIIIVGTMVCLVIICNVNVYAQTDLIYNCPPINKTKAIFLANQSQTYAVNSIGYYVTFNHVWCGNPIGNNRVNVEFNFYSRGPYAWCINYMDFTEDLNLTKIMKLINYGGNCQQPNPNRHLILPDSIIYDGIAHKIPPPLTQYESGVLKDSIRCKEHLRLILGPSNLPSCLTQEHAMKLKNRGWGQWPINGA